ncbi:YqjF family protein [Domibacillus mangrovi]|uniref:DUF2071 domain-containing protein n=1 Tax=Domibacillus mangrovi TaxID=1714354 RepID=A0A1Q5P094_9BACI|nr:DUF2071 domain-containing protein [Domibacillus mangrovi]OKL35690.1 hypothetical protein BLL40_14000 [Domibacillus mangrovi]
MYKELREVEQRPYPLPSSQWMMKQTWSNMLFAHWPVSADLLRVHIPVQLKIDLCDGTAWMSLIPFQTHHTRLHFMPKFPFYHSYLELNVRTYVTYEGVPGIYFFSLDANKWPIVTSAKIGAALPYKHARMKMTIKDPVVHYTSQRQHPGSSRECFQASYQQSSSIYVPDKESLEYWLLERYCFWTLKGNTLYRGDIHHDRWRITKAQADLHHNTMASFLPRHSFQNEPLLHFSSNKSVFTWPLKKVR